ncbi:DUF3231 family protein (plasmid) [Cytobacillus spongiae]|uniref:DUF3231 family protein n=1 Tax=Cytobacillus spongiae TaxID=2901381 RepID=UPI001F2132A9|nr:DUF3231 family protein [Cytobacillus spongiae]UII58403.1 DUF3231 family protein [Cytobacillus spongiae]
MSNSNLIKLTSSEIASLWQEYISHTHSRCMLLYLIATTKDEEIVSVLKEAFTIVEETKEATLSIIKKENLPIPIGFSDEDVNTKAKKLFSDSFSLYYIKNLSRVMASACGLMMTMSTRGDIRTHYEKCTVRAFKVFNSVSDVLLQKGLYVRPPHIQPNTQSVYIKGKQYLDGYRLIREERPLNAVEISHVFGNLEANLTGITFTKAFGQTIEDKEVRDFMSDSVNMGKEIISKLSTFLTSSDLSAPMPSDIHVNPITESAFSNKYMMYQMSTMMASGISGYASSLAASMRNDLKTAYMEFLTETSKLARKGANIMIANQWLEQPPQPASLDRE